MSQTFVSFELIIIDDGSTDGTADIVECLARLDDRIFYHRQDNAGIVVALNTALSHARGEYIARMDADDIAFPDRFKFQVGYLDAHAGCAIVGGIAVEFGGPPGTERLVTGGRHRRTDLSVFPPKVAVAVHPLIMVRGSVMSALQGYRGRFPHAEDYDLYLRAASYGTIDNPDVQLLRYRRHAGALSVMHVNVQERSAALAEIEAMRVARLDTSDIGQTLIESYIRFRIWRRRYVMGDALARSLLPLIAADIFRISPSILMSRPFWSLKLRMAGSLARNYVASVKSKLRSRIVLQRSYSSDRG